MAPERIVSENQSFRMSYGVLAYVMVSIVGLTFGFAVWMTTIDIRIREQGDAIEALKSVDKRLTRMENLLENLTREKNK